MGKKKIIKESELSPSRFSAILEKRMGREEYRKALNVKPIPGIAERMQINDDSGSPPVGRECKTGENMGKRKGKKKRAIRNKSVTQNKLDVSEDMSRGDFLKITGVGAAALGASAVGFGGTAHGSSSPGLGDACSNNVGGFPQVIPDGSGPLYISNEPNPPLGPFYILHPNYDAVASETGHSITCGTLESGCIPFGHGQWGQNELTDYGIQGLLGYFVGIDAGVNFLDNAPSGQVPAPPAPPLLFPGNTWGQLYAVQGATLAFLEDEYRSRPSALNDVSEMPLPSELGIAPQIESIAKLTTRVQFNVNHPVFGPQKLFGYFIKGKGDKEKPLILHMNGITEFIESTSPVNKGNFLYLMQFVNSGFDILFIDKPGHGWSTGKVSLAHPLMFFSVIDQLHTGCSHIGPGESEVSTGALMEGNPKEAPIILSGHSLGALINQGLVAANIAPALYGVPPQVAGYNFKGVIDVEGLPGGIKYTSPGLLRMLSGYMFFMSFAVETPQGNGLGPEVASWFVPARSELVATLPYWPPLMVVTTTYNYQSPAGAVYAYNTHPGLKKILLLEGYHGTGFLEPNMHYLATDAIAFAKEAAATETQPADSSTTTVEELLCSSPHAKTDATPAPLTAGPLAKYENGFGKKISEAIDEHSE